MARSHRIPYWDPEDTAAWEAGNGAVARRNLLWIVACDHIAFGIWTLWPVMVLFMPQNVYGFSAADKFLLGVRACVFGPDTNFQTDIGYRVAAFEAEGYRPRDELVYVAHSEPGRMVARFAQRDDRTLFLFVYADDDAHSADPHDLGDTKVVLRQAFGTVGWECPQILTQLDQADDVYFDRVSQITMNCWSKDRVALIGDAACCVSLLAGEGTGLAMLQAYVLAGELNAAGGDHREAFHRYERLLRPLIEGKQRSARAFASTFAPKTSLGLWTRNKASKLMAVPVLADWIIRHEFRDDIKLPDYEM
jgi:2-polyprenyl-6-methoxyphenol hydroxylase-like FAD-dependent oxidoreductase